VNRTNAHHLEHALTSARVLTVRDLFDALCEAGADDREAVAAVVDLLGTGRVRVVRSFRDGRSTIG
jgi:hypothetical protein